jgi:site-specific DNA-cytosine methylase
MENDQDYSMKQLDLFGNCEPEDAGYALRWQKMSVDCSPQMMVSHLQGASESYSTAGLVKQDGDYSTASISVWPKDGSACSLSQILEANPLTKYSLSPKACQGRDATKGVGEGIQDVVGTLCNADHKGAGNQYVNDNKVIVEQKETYCLQGGGETSQSSQGSGVNKDVAFTLNGLDKHGVAYEDKKSMSFAPSDLKRGFGQKPEIELSGTLKKAHNDQSPHVATYEWHNQDSRIREQQQASTLSCNAGGKEGNLVRENLTVRRLTPIECERLQGFPDNWTSEKMELILEGNEWKATGKVVKQADGPRYKAMGNAVTVNVAEWIGKQIGKVLNETK